MAQADSNSSTPSRVVRVASWSDLAEYYPGLGVITQTKPAELSGCDEESDHLFGGVTPPEESKVDMRSYQLAALLAWHLAGCRGIIRSATGSGKTFMAVTAAASMLHQPSKSNCPLNTLVLVHGKQLVRQTYEYFCTHFGPSNVNYIADEVSVNENVHITVASIDKFTYYLSNLTTAQIRSNCRSKCECIPPGTSSSKEKSKYKCTCGAENAVVKVHEEGKRNFKKFLKNVDVLIFDEVHHISADTYSNLVKLCPAYYRLGLSGTPLKYSELEDIQLLSLIGPTVFDLPSAWLQERGFLAPAKLEVVSYDYTAPRTRSLGYNDARSKLLIGNRRRHSEIAKDISEALSEPNNRILVMTGNSVELAERIAQELAKRRVPRKIWTLVTGRLTPKRINVAFKNLRSGKIRCVIVTKLADEGIDVPDVNMVLITGGGKAYVSTVQRIGRGLRKKESGEHLLVRDYFVKGNGYLEDHDQDRLDTYEKEGFFDEIRVIEK